MLMFSNEKASLNLIQLVRYNNVKGVYTCPETMPWRHQWVSCLARPISSFHWCCNHGRDAHIGVQFTISHTGYSHAIKAFFHKSASIKAYCVKEGFIIVIAPKQQFLGGLDMGNSILNCDDVHNRRHFEQL